MVVVTMKQRHVASEFALFLTVGFAATASYVLVFGFLNTVAGLTPTLSATIAFLLLIPFHFASYSHLVFRHGKFSLGIALRYAMTVSFGLALNVGLVSIFWRYLLAAPLPALVLAIVPATIANFLLLKYVVFRDGPIAAVWQSKFVFTAATIAIASLALYATLAVTLLYTPVALHADDWRTYNDYFIDRDLWNLAIDRRNKQLSILPNAALLSNQTFFGGKISNLSLVNIGLLGAVAAMGAYVADLVLGNARTSVPSRLAVGSTLLAFGLVMLAPVTQLLDLGIRNAFVAFGVAGAAFIASGFLGPLSRLPTACCYGLFALIASTSSWTGAAAWALGVAGAVIMRERPIVILLYFVGGTAMGLLVLGPQIFSSAGAPTCPIGFDAIAQFILAFLGTVPIANLILSGNPAAAPFHATVVALSGLALYVALSFRILQHWRSNEPTLQGLGYTYFWMIAGWAILSSALLGTGRADANPPADTELSMTFGVGPLLFWIAMVSAAILAAYGPALQEQVHRRTSQMVILSAALAMMLANFGIMSTSIAHSYNSAADALTQVAIKRDLENAGAEFRHAASADLRDNPLVEDINLLLLDWHPRMGSEAVKHALARHGAALCSTDVRFTATDKNNGLHVTGNAMPASPGLSPVDILFFLNRDETVVGFALPAFAHRGAALGTDSLIQAFLQLLPFVSKTPGISGHFVGRVRDDLGRWDTLIIAGRDRGGNWCVAEELRSR